MKSKLTWLFGVLVLLSLTITNCSNPAGGSIGGGSYGTLSTTTLRFSGAFTHDGELTTFFAETTDDPSLSVGSLAITEQTDYALSGFIDDGDLTFRLKGVYNTVTNTYALSASSSQIKYQIAGTLTATGAKDAAVTVQVKDGENWKVFTYNVAPSAMTNNPAAPPTPTKDETSWQEIEGGIPGEYCGVWHDTSDNYWYLLITPTLIQSYEWDGSKWVEFEAARLPVVDVKKTGDVVDGVYTSYIVTADEYTFPGSGITSQEALFAHLGEITEWYRYKKWPGEFSGGAPSSYKPYTDYPAELKAKLSGQSEAAITTTLDSKITITESMAVAKNATMGLQPVALFWKEYASYLGYNLDGKLTIDQMLAWDAVTTNIGIYYSIQKSYVDGINFPEITGYPTSLKTHLEKTADTDITAALDSHMEVNYNAQQINSGDALWTDLSEDVVSQTLNWYLYKKDKWGADTAPGEDVPQTNYPASFVTFMSGKGASTETAITNALTSHLDVNEFEGQHFANAKPDDSWWDGYYTSLGIIVSHPKYVEYSYSGITPVGNNLKITPYGYPGGVYPMPGESGYLDWRNLAKVKALVNSGWVADTAGAFTITR
ncbi:hypothetical protein FACS189468_2340 [Spirochaetia bacterium]|nr:hypothetical protein FACS189468_2340 [Spirochaetia bacterium]